jgi:ATP:ADP antiporter, AAA family
VVTEQETASTPSPSLLDRALRLFSDVRAGEGLTAVLMTLNVFLVMFAYYVIKTAREALILSSEGGAELKAYASGVMAAVLVLILPGYNWLISNVSTRILLFSVVGFFLLCTEAFFLAIQAGMNIGFVFFIWVGIFSLSTIALFWSFANEVYDRSDGERLFPVIGIGMTGGAFAGSALAEKLFGENTSPGFVLQVAAGLLVLHGVLYAAVLARRDVKQGLGRDKDKKKEPSKGLRAALEGFAFLAQNRYIALIAVLIVVLNLVNTTGEYILGKYVINLADKAWLDAGSPQPQKEFIGQYIGAFYGDFFFWVNVAGVALQAFIASRLVKYFGIAGVLFALPLVAGAAYALASLGVAFTIFRWAKTAENATDYSIMNTARAMLWLPTTRDEKYKAKQTVDTLLVRSGDMISAGVVFVGTTWLALSPRGFGLVNVVLVAIWLFVAVVLVRKYHRLAAERGVDEERAAKP